jgi:hypothetical protein
MAVLLVVLFRAGAKDPPLDPKEIRRFRRDADQIPRGPYE